MTGYGFVEPTKGLVTQFSITPTTGSYAGQAANLLQYVHCVRIYETVCKPYLTIQVIIYDNNNIIENLGLIPNDPATVEIFAPPNSNRYTVSSMSLLKFKGEQVPDTLKYVVYTMDFIGPVYYQDRNSSILDGSYSNMPSTAAIQKIWGQYLGADSLSVLTTASTPIGTTEQPGIAPGEKPLTAIYRIMKSMVSAQYPQTGNWLLFRDNSNVKLAQLQGLLDSINSSAGGGKSGSLGQISSQFSANGQREYYVQKETWGAGLPGGVWGSGFNDPDIYHSIIVAQAESRGSAVQISGTGKQKPFTYDIAMGQIINQGVGNITLADISSLYSGISGKMPGSGVMSGSQITDSSRHDNATAPFNKTSGEQAFSAAVRGSPQLTLKVPLQTGLNATVGQGIWAYLVPPAGNLGNYNLNDYSQSGAWLVTDLVHEMFTDQREAPGTTSMQLTKGIFGAGADDS